MMKCPMLPVSFTELCRKEVINTANGCRLGYVCDVEIDTMCGRVNSLTVNSSRKIFGKPKCCTVRWEQIERIGADMILVRVSKIDDK